MLAVNASTLYEMIGITASIFRVIRKIIAITTTAIETTIAMTMTVGAVMVMIAEMITVAMVMGKVIGISYLSI